MVVQPGLFDVEERLRRLSDIGDAVEAYAAAVDFELFGPARILRHRGCTWGGMRGIGKEVNHLPNTTRLPHATRVYPAAVDF